MNVILLKEIEKLGLQHQEVTVKPGYARNYLIPQGLAIVSNTTNKKILKEKIKQADIKESKLREEMQNIANVLKEGVVKIGAKVGKEDKIFGTITPLQLVDAVKEQLGVEVDRKKIVFEEDVKSLGTFTANLHLHKEIRGKITFQVIAE